MQIVIDISEDLYSAVRKGLNLNADEIWDLRVAVTNGALLSKGHGRIIDESQIHNCGWNYIEHHAKTDAPTIIGVDKEE